MFECECEFECVCTHFLFPPNKQPTGLHNCVLEEVSAVDSQIQSDRDTCDEQLGG